MSSFKNIGEVILALRKNNNMTQQELSEKLGINRPSIAKIENSQRAVSLDEAISISQIFKISMDTLLGMITSEKNEENDSFVLAFRSKGHLSESDLNEIKEVEMLFDTLKMQIEIQRGE